MKNLYDVILRPVRTEKSYENAAEHKYTFEVAPKANKTEIKTAVEKIFKVKVIQVCTQTRKGKPKRMGRSEGYTSATKRAIVKLSPDSKPIAVFDTLS
ncbi:MAG: 50S ribosomal protein L23 [Christensenellales bacterium]|jgi:large subunit ribosomal protein L23